MKIYIQTLGCKVNQYETQALETLFLCRGHTICETDENCDAFIVNTCAVTADSGRKSRQAIRHLKAAHPDAVAAVCGCYSQISPEDAQALGVDPYLRQRRETPVCRRSRTNVSGKKADRPD